MNTSEQSTAIADVLIERSRQDAKWGEQNHPAEVWLAILTEEVGELATEMLRWRFDDPQKRYDRAEKLGISLIPRDNPRIAAREEAVQVAAVALAFIEAIDRAALAALPPSAPPALDMPRLMRTFHETGLCKDGGRGHGFAHGDEPEDQRRRDEFVAEYARLEQDRCVPLALNPETTETLLRVLHHAGAEHIRVWHGSISTKDRAIETTPLRLLINAIDLAGEHLGEARINHDKARQERKRAEHVRLAKPDA